MRDLDLLSSISGNIGGKTLCAFGDAAVTPVLTTLKHFRHEYEAHIREGRCTLPAELAGRRRSHSRARESTLEREVLCERGWGPASLRYDAAARSPRSR